MNVTAAVCVSLAWTYAEKLQFAMGFFALSSRRVKNGENPRIGQSKHGIASKKPSTVNELHLKCISAPSHTTRPRHANLNIKPTPPMSSFTLALSARASTIERIHSKQNFSNFSQSEHFCANVCMGRDMTEWRHRRQKRILYSMQLVHVWHRTALFEFLLAWSLVFLETFPRRSFAIEKRLNLQRRPKSIDVAKHVVQRAVEFECSRPDPLSALSLVSIQQKCTFQCIPCLRDFWSTL